MKVSVIIPSRLQVQPGSQPARPWLERALASVRQQTVAGAVELEIVVGLDPGACPPEGFAGLCWVNARKAAQAAAVNAAVAASSGDLLAFLEDDDYWLPRRLEYGLRCLGQFDLVTSNQHEVLEDATFVRVNDFPTPSGWLLRRATWDLLGPFDETIRFHVDNDYLGRVNARGLRRVHLVEAGAKDRPELRATARFSRIGPTREPSPLVIRTVNPDGGMSRIARDTEAYQQSQVEYRRFLEKYGTIPC